MEELSKYRRMYERRTLIRRGSKERRKIDRSIPEFWDRDLILIALSFVIGWTLLFTAILAL